MTRARPGWLHPTVVRVTLLAVAAGFAQFAVTTVLADVADGFGQRVGPGDIASQGGLSGTTLGVGLAVIRLAALGALVIAALADRVGRRRVLLTVTGAGLGLTALAGASPSYWAFVVVVALARPLLSGTNALVAVVAAEETSTRDRSRAIALVQAGYALGSGIVAVVHGFLDGEQWRWVFGIAVVPLVLLPLIARQLEEPPLFRRPEADAMPTLPGRVPRRLLGRLVVVSVLAAVTALVTGPALTYLFFFGESVLHASPAYMAGLVLLAGPVGLAGLLTGRWAADRFGRRLAAGLATVAIAAAATFAYSDGIVALSIGYLVTIAASGAFGPAGGALLAEVFPTSVRATANGWVTAAGVLGAVVGLAAIGALFDALGSFAGAAALVWLPTIPVAALYLRLPETRDLELDDPSVAGVRS